jgi:hypothetical protein
MPPQQEQSGEKFNPLSAFHLNDNLSLPGQQLSLPEVIQGSPSTFVYHVNSIDGTYAEIQIQQEPVTRTNEDIELRAVLYYEGIIDDNYFNRFYKKLFKSCVTKYYAQVNMKVTAKGLEYVTWNQSESPNKILSIEVPPKFDMEELEDAVKVTTKLIKEMDRIQAGLSLHTETSTIQAEDYE